MEDNLQRKRSALLIVLGVNLALVIIIFILGGISGSMGLKAAAWMSVENLFLTAGVFLGVILSGREDARISKRITLSENLITILISLFIFYVASRMFIKIVSGPQMMLRNIPAMIMGIIFGAGLCYFMSSYKIYIGRTCSAPSIEAAGYHCKTHVFMWLAVAAGLVGYMVGLTALNRLAVVAVLTYVLYVGWMIFYRSYRSLISGLPPEHACHLKHTPRQKAALLSALFFLYLLSGFYIVSYNEEGVIRRFGRWLKEPEGIFYHRSSPGIGYRLPFPIETVEMVKVDEVKRLNTGEISLLTGDENLVKVKFGIHYRIKDAADYLFSVSQPSELVVDNLDAAVRKVVGLNEVDYLLTFGKKEIEREVKELAQGLLDVDKAGVEVLSIQLLLLDPPEEVGDAFRDVASAMEDKVAFINEAEAYRNQVIPEAKGEALAKVRRAEGYQIKKVNNSRGEAENYIKQLKEYVKEREITDLRLYIEALEEILPGVEKVIVDPRIEQETTDLWLFDKSLKGKVVGLE